MVHQVHCGDLISCISGCMEKFPFLFFFHTAPGIQVWIRSLPLHVGQPLASVLHPDRRGLKEHLIRGLWLTQARGREGYRVRGEPVVAEASVTLQQPEVCLVFSPGSCSWITGPWQWWAAQAPRWGGVDSDLCLHTGFLVAPASALAFHAHLWCLR